MAWLVTGSVVAVCLYMAWTIGANDVANSMGGAVGSNSITLRRAIILAAFCEFAGSVLVGTDVTDTIRKGIVVPETLSGRPEVLCLGMGCALLASAFWIHVATWLGMPVSTTHSIVGAVAGFGIVAAGWQSVSWGKMGGIVLSWFISPVAGLVCAYVFFRVILRTVLGRPQPLSAAARAAPFIVFVIVLIVALSTIYDGMKNLVTRGREFLTGPSGIMISVAVALVGAVVARVLTRRYAKEGAELSLAEQLRRVERFIAPLVVLTSSSVAFSHGANDVANAVGPMAAVLDVLHTGTVKMQVNVPLWVLALGGVGIVVGLATYGHVVMRTIGSKITELTPSRAIAADIATAGTVLFLTRLGMPISTTHTIVGAVLGVGLARGLGAVNRQVTRNIFGSWLATVPAAAGMAVLLFVIGQSLGVHTLLKQLMPAVSPAP